MEGYECAWILGQFWPNSKSHDLDPQMKELQELFL